jgi:hypothetical protein
MIGKQVIVVQILAIIAQLVSIGFLIATYRNMKK